eukprot:3759231-Rhodomonas_salina.2
MAGDQSEVPGQLFPTVSLKSVLVLRVLCQGREDQRGKAATLSDKCCCLRRKIGSQATKFAHVLLVQFYNPRDQRSTIEPITRIINPIRGSLQLESDHLGRGGVLT